MSAAWMSSPLVIRTAWAVFAVAAILYQASVSLPFREFTSFGGLHWQPSSGCRLELSDSHRFRRVSRVVTWNLKNPHNTALCLSDWLVVDGNYVELEMAGYADPADGDKVYAAIENDRGEELARFHVGADTSSGIWRRHPLVVPDRERIRVRLVDGTGKAGWAAVRNRINFYRVLPLDYRRFELFRSKKLQAAADLLFSLAAAALVTAMLFRIGALTFDRGNARLQRWLLYAALAIAMHFRTGPHFFYDDFMFLERLHEAGWQSLFYKHNEHIVPLFAAFFAVLYELFEDQYQAYILVSTLVLAGCAILLEQLLLLILRGREGRERAAFLATSLFVISALHTESMQWVSCVCVLLCAAACLGAAIALVHYLRRGGRRLLAAVAVCVVAAPLFFGGGIVLAVQLPALILLMLIVDPELSWPAMRPRMLAAVSTIWTATAVVALLYWIRRDAPGIGESLADAAELPTVEQAVRFFTFGSFFGTVLRGLGISSVFGVEEFFREDSPYQALGLSPYTTAPLIGAAVCAAVGLIYLRSKDYRACAIWLFGLLSLCAPFALMVFGRARYGVSYSLQLRYHSLTIIGLIILISPLCCRLLRCLELPLAAARPQLLRGAAYATCCLLAAAFTYQQTALSRKVLNYSVFGYFREAYAEQLRDWHCRLARAGNNGKPLPFEGGESDLAGLYPFLYGGSPLAPSARVSREEPELYRNLFGAEPSC